jgi:hypothetical protein
MEMERPNNKQNNIKRAFHRKVESPNNINRAFQQKGGKP